MAVKVLIPTMLRNLTANDSEVQVEAADIDAMLAALDEKYPGFKNRLCDDRGQLRLFVNVFLNEEDIRLIDAQATKISDGDEVSIMAAIGGG